MRVIAQRVALFLSPSCAIGKLKLPRVLNSDDTVVTHETKELKSFIQRVCYIFRHAFIMSDSKCPVPPPSIVRGMTILDRSAFKAYMNVPGLPVPVKSINAFNKKFKASLCKITKLKPIVLLAESDELHQTHRLFLLDPNLYKTQNDFSSLQQDMLKEIGVDIRSLRLYPLELGYDNWNVSEIMEAVLPEGTSNISGFSTIGHIAHFNLKPEVLKYKHLIGQVVMDKNTVVKTVVNKLSIIDNTFRNFQMELLAGEENYITRVKENGLTFEFDFSKVYWNPRLGTEHMRIIDSLGCEDVLYDVFAGVGPFSVPAAKKGVTVLANDLNSHSYKSLQNNVKLNKVKGSIECYNLDGREFIKTVVKDHLCKTWKKCVDNETKTNIVLTMNLPALAVEFLDSFVGLLADVEDHDFIVSEWVTMPKVNCYGFSKSDDPKKDMTDRVVAVLGSGILHSLNIRRVRNVAPNKDMLCATFTLNRDVLLDQQHQVLHEGPPAKQLKMEKAAV
ncbi:hypothetical protein CHS0354_029080 [Potamilus streckersoni]|uniref:tRNA (guanine(37)-N1)-methyltransferase n=1 Tax=Potamilus streckersoni TaxID=2493646 RepID=A0AAE0W3D9_9BIVA|nr:hypothetical protein CHS0354_029080 [Potamilus streckersoni]